MLHLAALLLCIAASFPSEVEAAWSAIGAQLAPSFAIRIWGPAEALRRATQGYWKCRSEFAGFRSRREYVANYWR
jgi:hypothetical protein